MYRHLFFDLDHTLWDFDRNSAESITEMYETHRLADLGVPSADAFSQQFIAINHQLWDDFHRNLIDHAYIREHRFPMVFRALGLSNGPDLNEVYLRLLSQKSHLIESARAVLDHLAGRYQLHIITNGFDDIQAVKMANADITGYFTHVVTMERAGAKKPDPRIFDYALRVSGASATESLMLGDSYEADILGAMNAGLHTVFYNPTGKPAPRPPTYNIQHWQELMAIL
jgi:YjjG family noncanonical pyrimidine nucleotidase